MVIYLAAHYAVFPHLPVATSISDTKVLFRPQYLGKTNLHFSFSFVGASSLSRITRGDNISNFYTFRFCFENGSTKSTHL